VAFNTKISSLQLSYFNSVFFLCVTSSISNQNTDTEDPWQRSDIRFRLRSPPQANSLAPAAITQVPERSPRQWAWKGISSM